MGSSGVSTNSDHNTYIHIYIYITILHIYLMAPTYMYDEIDGETTLHMLS